MNKDKDLFKNFLLDLVTLLKEDALNAKKDYEKNKGGKIENEQFNSGRNFAYYEVFDTIKNQLFAFQINPKEIGFDIDPEDLLSNTKLQKGEKKLKN